jgi:hypothetical protein
MRCIWSWVAAGSDVGLKGAAGVVGGIAPIQEGLPQGLKPHLMAGSRGPRLKPWRT